MQEKAHDPDGTELHILNTQRGHKKAKEQLTIESPIDDRKKFGAKVKKLLSDGYTILIDGRRVVGYDPKTNEWVTKAVRKATPKSRKNERVPAKGTKADAVAPLSGG